MHGTMGELDNIFIGRKYLEKSSEVSHPQLITSI